MRKNFWFGVFLTLSILLVVWVFDYAESFRGCESIGGEVFMIALPLWIVHCKLTELGQKIERLKKHNQDLAKKLIS